MATTAQEQLVKYLTDAHGMEQQSLTMLETATKVAGDPDIEQVYRGHLTETREHERMIGERLEAHGESPSKLKDVAGRVGALGIGGAAAGSPDTPGKLTAAAYGFEHLEIASYELLRRVAERAGDTETVSVADRILGQERSAVEKIEWTFDRAVERSLADQGIDS